METRRKIIDGTQYRGDRNDINRVRIPFTFLILLNGILIKNTVAGVIWINCGGTVDGIRKIKGCFGALNITKYVNLENGLMKHPNEIFAVKMANRSKCSMSIDFENKIATGDINVGLC